MSKHGKNDPHHGDPEEPASAVGEVSLNGKRKRYANAFAFLALFLLLIAAALLNPGQEKHLDALRIIADAKKLSDTEVPSEIVVRISKYQDYFVFSTVTFGENKILQESVTISYGFLGAVKTTSRVNDVLYAISQWEKSEPPHTQAPR